MRYLVKLAVASTVYWVSSLLVVYDIINPRHVGGGLQYLVALCVCVCVCLSVCYHKIAV